MQSSRPDASGAVASPWIPGAPRSGSDGHVRIYSELCEGTTIKIYLPRLSGTDEEPAETSAKYAAMTKGSGEAILVVEDEPALRAYAVEALRGLDYRVLEAADGREALALAEQHPEIALLSRTWS